MIANGDLYLWKFACANERPHTNSICSWHELTEDFRRRKMHFHHRRERKTRAIFREDFCSFYKHFSNWAKLTICFTRLVACVGMFATSKAASAHHAAFNFLESFGFSRERKNSSSKIQFRWWKSFSRKRIYSLHKIKLKFCSWNKEESCIIAIGSSSAVTAIFLSKYSFQWTK